jgi:hypothetical protein
MHQPVGWAPSAARYKAVYADALAAREASSAGDGPALG